MQSFLYATLLVASLGIDPQLAAVRDLSTYEQQQLAETTRADVPREIRERMARMSSEEQLREYFDAGPTVRGRSRQTRNVYSLDRFLSDPALRHHFEGIDVRWLDPASSLDLAGVESPRLLLWSLIELKVMVARNLYLRDHAPTEAAVRHEVREVLDTRRRFADLSLYAGRSVIYAASDDTLDDGRNHFGRLANRAVMERDAARFHFFRGDEAPASGVGFEELFRTERDLTFVFEGHGREKALKFDGKLTARRLARLLAERPAHFPAAVVILDACRAHDFARHLFDELAELPDRGPLPVVVVPEEYGQSVLKDVFGGRFLRQELRAADGAGASVGSALRARSVRLSVYVPDAGDRPMQIG